MHRAFHESRRFAFAVLVVLTVAQWAGAQGEARRPNIVVIVSDDAGYADFSMHGSTEIPTPRIDSIAACGVRFSQGYVSASVCSPTRAGLLTGRYQQRFGHELNIPPSYSEVNGLPIEEVTLARLLREAGYRTIALGKWHLGYAPRFHPLSRGFDDYFGFLQGARSYRPIAGNRLNRLLRGREPIEERFDYLTDELGRKAADYIHEHHDRPFFIYLCFNAVHTPMHAREDDLAHFSGISGNRRRKLAAMTRALDRSVGLVLDALRENEVFDDTLVFFVNDNGGANNNASRNTPFRGAKGSLFEGGIRVPFVVQWPRKLPSGAVYANPVISLDVFSTALAAAEISAEPTRPLDGVDLLPHLTGERFERPHRRLHWRQRSSFAVRDGDLKLVRPAGGQPLLFDLTTDGSETRDLAASRPDAVDALLQAHEDWASELMKPRWGRRSREPEKPQESPAGDDRRPR